MRFYAIANKDKDLLHIYHESNEVALYNGRTFNLSKVMYSDKLAAEDMLSYLNKSVREFSFIGIEKSELKQFKVVEVELDIKI